jgi:hypothetical protein
MGVNWTSGWLAAHIYNHCSNSEHTVAEVNAEMDDYVGAVGVSATWRTIQSGGKAQTEYGRSWSCQLARRPKPRLGCRAESSLTADDPSFDVSTSSARLDGNATPNACCLVVFSPYSVIRLFILSSSSAIIRYCSGIIYVPARACSNFTRCCEARGTHALRSLP